MTFKTSKLINESVSSDHAGMPLCPGQGLEHDWVDMEITNSTDAPFGSGYKFRTWTREVCRNCKAIRRQVWDNDGYGGQGIPTVQL